MTKLTPNTYRHVIGAGALNDGIAAMHYESMRHEPYSPGVRLTYLHFELETVRQYVDLLSAGYVFTWHDGSDDYANSAAMFADLERRQLRVRLSFNDGVPSDHPMAAVARDAHGNHFTYSRPFSNHRGLIETVRGRLTLNDIFRAVHDVNGHGRAHAAGKTASFGPIGERNAWLAHRDTYSSQALTALWCETRGQAAWTNAYGDHAAMPLKDRPFAEQKAGHPAGWLV